MTRLRDQRADLAALVTQAAEATGIPPAFVEKDFWVVELLRSVSAPIEGAIVVFKGGTSLSKAYGLVERFSEDVDILLVAPGAGENQRDRLLKGICGRVESDLGVSSDDPFSKRGVLRNVRYRYESSHRDGRISEGVLLEMGIRGNPDPHEERTLRSYVAEHALEVFGVDETEYDELQPVRVNVLRPERTLVEKLSILHHLETLDFEAIAATEKGRHFYDVHQLLGDRVTVSSISVGDYVATTARDAELRSKAHGWPFTPRPDGGFAASAAFDPGGLKARALREAHERVRPLVYGAFPSFDEVVARVRSHGDLL